MKRLKNVNRVVDGGDFLEKKKFAFIICVNNEIYFEECKYYIERLKVPEEYELEIIPIRGAESMCAAYNQAMNTNDAKYKIYMHQDVFIRNTDFLKDILHLFEKHQDVGMIGMVGGNNLPKTGVVYRAWNAGVVDSRDPDMAYYLQCAPECKEDVLVEGIDGLLMATQYDIQWREDLFDYFDFYDVSQSFEMRKKGYHILVPYQKVPWVIHDSSFAKLNHYDENRVICLEEYGEYLKGEQGFPFSYDEEWDRLSDGLATHIKMVMERGQWDVAAEVIETYRKMNRKSSVLEMLGVMSDIQQEDSRFFAGLKSYQAIYQKYVKMRFLMRRMELGMPEEEFVELKSAILRDEISFSAVLIFLIRWVVDKRKVLDILESYYRQGNRDIYLEQIQRMKKEVLEIPVAYTQKIS